MKPREFYDKVVQMRRMQKEYFKNRSSIALQKSKQLEKEIDDETCRGYSWAFRGATASGEYI